MRHVLLWGCLGVVAWIALPAHAEDDGAGEIQRLRQENAHLNEALDKMKAESTRLANATRELSGALAEFRANYAALSNELASVRETLNAELARLRRDVRARDQQHVRAQLRLESQRHALARAEEQTEYVRAALARDHERHTKELAAVEGQKQAALHKLREEKRWLRDYFGPLLAAAGESAVGPIVERLMSDPELHAPRLCPLLGQMGATAKAALPALRTINADERYRRRGVARYAAEAHEAIREAMDAHAADAAK